MGAFLFVLLGSAFSFAADFGGVVGRLPVLVNSRRDLALVRVITPDHRLGFQTCPVSDEVLSSDRALTVHVNGGLACSDVGSDWIDLGDTSAVTALEAEYPLALERRLNTIRKESILTAIDTSAFLGIFTGGAMMLASRFKVNPLNNRVLSASIVGGLSLLSTYETMNSIRAEQRSLHDRPPTVFEQDVVQLVKARDVTNPENFASPLIFRNVRRALASAMHRVNLNYPPASAATTP